jgi:hypothetical protein
VTHLHDDQIEVQHFGASSHDHDCGNRFGCGQEKGTGVVREDIKEPPSADGPRIVCYIGTR